MFLGYKITHSKDSECTESLDVFSPADALHVKYPLSPITIYATKQEVEQYEYIGNLQNVSTDIMRMHQSFGINSAISTAIRII